AVLDDPRPRDERRIGERLRPRDVGPAGERVELVTVVERRERGQVRPARGRDRILRAAGEVLEELPRLLVVADDEVRNRAVAIRFATVLALRPMGDVVVERARRLAPPPRERVHPREEELRLVRPRRPGVSLDDGLERRSGVTVALGAK